MRISIVGLVLALSAIANLAEDHPGDSASDPTELRGFVDGVMEAQLKAHHFAGAVVVVVRAGQVVL